MAGNFIELPVTFDQSAGPIVSLYRDIIGRDERLVAWYTPNASSVVDDEDDSNRVTAIRSRGAASADATQTVATRMPLHQDSDASIGGRPSLLFDSARGDRLNLPDIFPAGPSADHTRIVLFHVEAFPADTSQFVLAGTRSATNAHELIVAPGGALYNRIGRNSGIGNVIAQGAYAAGAWTLAIATFDSASGKAGISVNGGPFATATNAAAHCLDPTCTIGAYTSGEFPFGGYVADVMIINADLSKVENTDMLATVKSYFRDRYEVELT